MWYALLIISALSGTSCATTLESMSEDFTLIEGHLVIAPVLEFKDTRLLFYLKDEKDELKVGLAENEENKEVLRFVKAKLTGSRKPVILYVQPISKGYAEFISGIDFKVHGVAFYNEASDDYMVVSTDYGDRALDSIKGLGWGGFLESVAKRAARGALP